MHSPPTQGLNINWCITLFNGRKKHRESKLSIRVFIIINKCQGVILHNRQNGLEYKGFVGIFNKNGLPYLLDLFLLPVWLSQDKELSQDKNYQLLPHDNNITG